MPFLITLPKKEYRYAGAVEGSRKISRATVQYEFVWSWAATYLILNGFGSSQS